MRAPLPCGDARGNVSAQVGYINAHATSTPLGDTIEATCIQALLQRGGLTAGSSPPVPVSSFKGALGHLLGAAGAVESIFTVVALHTVSGGVWWQCRLQQRSRAVAVNAPPLPPLTCVWQSTIPGTPNCTQLDPAVSAAAPLTCFPCAGVSGSSGSVATTVGRSGGMRSAVKNSFGFGGTNCSVVYAAP